MAITHLSSLLHLCTIASFPRLPPPHLNPKPYQNPPPRRTLVCSAEKSSKKGRPPRARKSNEELRGELREFMAAVGIPDDRTPSTKELSEHGRKDLANIVRRRGYKAISELLRHSSENGMNAQKNSLGNQDTGNACRDEVSEEQERNLNKSAGSFSTTGSSLEGNCMVRANGSIATNIFWNSDPSESSTDSLQLKATDFVHTGFLNILEDASEIKSTDMPIDFEVNSNILDTKSTDPASVVSRQIPSCSMEHQTDRHINASREELDVADFDMELASEMAAEKDNQIEIDRLKAMLNQKEMELSLLNKQVEKEKQALSDLQAMANAEVGNAQRFISAKDVKLDAAEESHMGLKEVQIEYWANGEFVEVAGSFNGWHHQIKMDLQMTSNSMNPPGSRESKLWSTVLWLYPGTYEIKFIVDGHWRLDSQRETITIGSFENNILRVDR